MIYVLTLICAGHISPQACDIRTARAYRASVEPGVICGLPYQNSFAIGPLAPTSNEYIITRCKARTHP